MYNFYDYSFSGEPEFINILYEKGMRPSESP